MLNAWAVRSATSSWSLSFWREFATAIFYIFMEYFLSLRELL